MAEASLTPKQARRQRRDERNRVSTSHEGRQMDSLKRLHTPRTGRRFGYLLVGMLVFAIAAAFLPWQQSVHGTGTVTAFNPRNRPQTVQNAIAGRITSWHVLEGQLVKRGDTLLGIAEIKDDYFDPALLERLAEQRQAKLDYITSVKEQIDQNGRQLTALQQSLELSLRKGRNKLLQARNKVLIDSANSVAQKLQLMLSERQFARYQELYEKNGLISLTDLEKRRQTLQEKRAYATEAENKMLNTRNEQINVRLELGSLQAEYADKLAKTRGDKAAKEAALADAASELSKLNNKMANVRVRQQQYFVLAPQDGNIVRALKAGIGETIKEGEPVVTIMPSKADKAVELFVRPMDLPLLAIGQQARIEFDGWPALQFSGWAKASVGTFGGRIAVIDYVATAGLYRILIQPDPKLAPWPDQIRLGSGAKGWAMLGFVPLGYEFWRQLNGFPPDKEKAMLAAKESKGGGKESGGK